jgi:preprotein translocase subunit SecF
MSIPIVKTRRVWYLCSAVLLAGSIVCIALFGLNIGMDFTGGSLLEVEFESVPPSPEQVRERLSEIGLDHLTAQTTGENEMLFRTRDLDEAEHQRVLAALRENFGDIEEQRFESIGPAIGAELRERALIGILLTLFLIGLYVASAFRKVSEPVASWKYGVLTLATAFHDVLVPLGAFAVLGQFFGWQIDAAFVAAILTILGYSINDTIVVFDRTRENVGKRRGEPFEHIVELSIRQTFRRSLMTGMSSLLALAAITIFGGESTRPFALTLMIGIVAGTYSSIFVASPLLVSWEKWKLGIGRRVR